MYKRTDVVFVYDGTFEGFLCCVYEYYYSYFNPVEIVTEEDIQPGFYQFVTIQTDKVKATKVYDAICEKISKYTIRFLQECMLCYGKEKEYYMLWYVINGFKTGNGIYDRIELECVNWLRKANRHLKREKHLFLGITRFYKANDVYIAVINPKNKILPIVAYHFTQRFAQDDFMIYDKTNKMALLYNHKKAMIISADDVQLPHLDEEERNVQKLWKLFYDTIAIDERYNPRCRMNFMPKRTWELLPELQEN